MKARALTVTHVASGDLWAGAEVQLYNLVMAANNGRDVQPTVVLLNEGMLAERVRSANVPVLVLNERRMSITRQIWAAADFLKSCGSNIVHTHRYKEHLIGGVAAKLRRLPSIRTVHSAPVAAISPFQKLARMLDRRVISRLQGRVVCVSAELVPLVRREFPSASIEVIENGIDEASVRQRAGRLYPRLADLKPVSVAWVGRMEAVKRPDLVLAIARELNLHAPGKFHFTLYGEGSLSEKIRAEIAESELHHAVRLAGFEEKMATKLACSDVLLMTSDHEGMPMVLLEAMALELPIVAPRVGGIPEVLSGGQFGVLVDRQEADAYVAALMALDAERHSARARGRAAFIHLTKRYSANRMASAYESVYRNVLGS